MLRHSFFAAVILTFAVLSDEVWAAAPKKPAKVDPGRDAVEKVLRAEIAGQVDRRMQLADELQAHPDSPSARWQAGFLRSGGSWKGFDEVAEPADAEAVERYVARRGEAAQTFADQIQLADWCRAHRLLDRERAHLTRAMCLAPVGDHSKILERLGFCRIENNWFSAEQIAGWQEMNRRAAQSMNQWGRKLEKIAEKLAGPRRLRDAATTELKQVKTGDAIPAIEYSLCGRDEPSAEAGIEALASMDNYEATIALAKQAAFSRWHEVRKHATQLLKTRPLDDFVPDLIGLLASPLVTNRIANWQYLERGPVHGREGKIMLLYTYVIARETDDQFQVQVMQTIDHRLNLFVDAISQGKYGLADKDSVFRWNLPPQFRLTPREAEDQARVNADQIREADRLIETENDRTAELNTVIINVLAGVSGLEPNSDPKMWWQWWSEQTDTTQIGNKPTVVTVAEYSLGDPGLWTRYRRLSCFAAGTLVWSDSGLVAIESIQVGDRVLSQDVETGEVSYQPVLETTVRPPKELTTLQVGQESIVCTGGHRFWASGEGWVKARDLSSQMLLHTVTGNTPVSEPREGGNAETYNLVVDGFHTYFVGKAGLLCQDLLPPQRTNSIVPGLPRANAVAPEKSKTNATAVDRRAAR